MKEVLDYEYTFSSILPGVSATQVWERISSWEGVNYELGPLVQLSVPSQYPRVSDIPADGHNHFNSKVLLLGFLPIDIHRFALRAIDPPNLFDERSSNGLMRVWAHKRTLTPVEGGVEVTDNCGFEPRLGLLGGLLLITYRYIFRRRHRRLVRYFARD